MREIDFKMKNTFVHELKLVTESSSSKCDFKDLAVHRLSLESSRIGLAFKALIYLVLSTGVTSRDDGTNLCFASLAVYEVKNIPRATENAIFAREIRSFIPSH